MEIRKPQNRPSYKPGEKALKIKRVNKKAKQKKNKITLILLTVSLSLVATIILVARANFLAINSIVVSGARTEYNTSIQELATATLAESYMYIIPKKNILFYPEKELTKRIKKDYSNLDSVVLKRKNLHIIEIVVVERVPTFYITEAGISNAIFVDSTGYVFKDDLLKSTGIYSSSTAISETNAGYTASSTDSLPIDFNNKVGSTMEREYFDNIVSYIKLLESTDIHVFGVLLRPYEDAEIQINQSGGHLRVNLKDDPVKVLANFKAIRKTEALKNIFSNNRDSLKYIDLRFGNKVFYRNE